MGCCLPTYYLLPLTLTTDHDAPITAYYFLLHVLTAHLDAHRVAVGLLGRGLGLGPALRLKLREVLVELRAARALTEVGR